MWGHKFNLTVAFLGLAGTASLLSGCYPGDEHSYMVWGAKGCESCPSDYEFEALPGDIWGCGTEPTEDPSDPNSAAN